MKIPKNRRSLKYENHECENDLREANKETYKLGCTGVKLLLSWKFPKALFKYNLNE